MTVPSTPRRAGPYSGNGSTTSFSFSFKVFDKTNVQVLMVDSLGQPHTLVLDSDYTVSVNADQVNSPGGTITYPKTGSPLPTGATLSIIGALPYTQTTTLPGGGNFSPVTVEQTFDSLVIQIQQLAEQAGRALTLPASETGQISLPGAASRANTQLLFDSLGNPYVAAPVSGTAADVLLQIASAVDATKGAGLQGYSSALSYGANTTGAALNTLNGLFSSTAGKGATLVPKAVLVVDNITALRALLKTSAANRAITMGYTTAGDGGHGVYRYDSTDTTTADNGGSVIVASDGGRWKLLVGDSISVMQFGAKGDGATDDSAAVQAAHDWSKLNGFPAVDFKPGATYLLNTTINWSPYVRARAAGEVTLKTTSTSNTKMFWVSTQYGNLVSFTCGPVFDGKFTFQQSGANVNIAALYLGDTSSGTGFGCTGTVVARGCHFLNFQRAIQFGFQSYILTFDHCYFKTCVQTIYTAAAVTSMGERMVFHGCVWDSCTSAYVLNSSVELFIKGGSIDYCTNISANSSGDHYLDGVHIEWNNTSNTLWALASQSLHLLNVTFNFAGASAASPLIASIGVNAFVDSVNCSYRLPIAGITGYSITAGTGKFNGPSTYYTSNNAFGTYVANGGGGTLHTF